MYIIMKIDFANDMFVVGNIWEGIIKGINLEKKNGGWGEHYDRG